ncbi:KAP family P-loop NTPase fold protein [Catalinimonas niigatensis]|uniref:KAP family P-loop NTPase fold protein n=1 Tax=Catalinimonas niigatensis TaxID=1397264 RepID=UPI0026658B6C|nr:P-loop NTPase fold protein [Catalinimonas niigatensis]WPP49653.1 P-loop NTPase fold protein [Catalinimonas niigatensis]
MKSIERIYQFIFTRNKLLFISGIIFFVLFRKPIELFISETVVKYVFAHINSIWYNDIVFLLIVSGVIILTLHRYNKYIPSYNFSCFLLSISVVYIGYRLTDEKWYFTAFSFISYFKYADILILLSVCQLILIVGRKKEFPSYSYNSFFDDQPLGSKGNDKLGYNSYAELLGDKILSSHFSQAFAIGINGKWGLGKTSFIDLLKRKLQNDDIIEINFNAWNSHSPKAIIKDFFETVQEKIRPYHSSLSRLLIQYSNKLVAINNNKVTQSIQATISALTGFESLNSLYEDINKALKRINKKIVVYIDDLDRLDKDEIIEVIRLIRNTANFYNTFFIVAYDKNYVVNALKQHNHYRQEEFLEKIFQVEVTLPYFKKDALRYKLAEKLKEMLPEGIHSTIESEVIGTASSKPPYLNEWLESMRDVTRLTNALLLNLSKLTGEVDFCDFMRIELLRIKYPSAYELLHRKTLDFLNTTTRGSSNKNYYQLIKITEEEKRKLKDIEKGVSSYFELYLTRNYTELSIPQNEISKITDFVDGIFGSGTSLGFYSYSQSRSHLSIIFPSKFNRYFAYTLLDGALSEVEFSNARALNQNKFNSNITHWVEGGLEFEVKDRFSEVKSFDNREDYEKIIRAIFHLANQPSKNKGFYAEILVGYDGENLMHKMSNYDKQLVEKFYPETNGEQILRGFVNELFDQAASPFHFESDFIKYLNGRFSDSFPLTKEELKRKSLDYFRRYCSETDKLDRWVWYLFYRCEQTEWIPTGHNSHVSQDNMPAEAKEIMVDFIFNKDLDGFLFEIIDIESFKQKTFAINGAVLKVFNSWESFQEKLVEINEQNSKYLNEFKEFLAEFASKNYSQYVEFQFETIPVKEKMRK